jgi:hypothetical protein
MATEEQTQAIMATEEQTQAIMATEEQPNTITGEEMLEDFRNLLTLTDPKDFNAGVSKIISKWNTAPVRPRPDASVIWSEFCAKYPGASDSHIADHPAVTTNPDAMKIIRRILERHQTPQTEDEIKALNIKFKNDVVGAQAVLTKNIPTANWSQPAPHNNRLEYTIVCAKQSPQAADQFEPSDCSLMWRHTSGNKKSLGLLTEKASTNSTDKLKVSLWLTLGDDGKYKYYCPGSSYFTEKNMGSNFSPLVAFPNYNKEINDSKFTDAQKGVKQKNLYRQLTEYVNDVEKSGGKMWALDVNAL